MRKCGLPLIAACLAISAAGNSNAQAAPDKARFRMPSNRIHCMFVTAEGKTEPNGIACDIDQSVIRKPIRPRPSDCEYDWGQRFELGNDSDAGLQCASDWVGSEVRSSPMAPRSREAGSSALRKRPA